MIINVASHVYLNPGLEPSCILCILFAHFSQKFSTSLLLPTKSNLHVSFETQCRVNVASHVYLNPSLEPSCILCILYDRFFSTNSKIIARNQISTLRNPYTESDHLQIKIDWVTNIRRVVTVLVSKSSVRVFFWLKIELSVEVTTPRIVVGSFSYV
jgi:hypothetical protein